MNKIISLEQAFTIAKKIKVEGKTIVLVGGCFDIFHYGHFVFLKKAKSLGDILIVALESDQKVRKLKGEGRPITPLGRRAEILSAFSFVDYILLLHYFSDDITYNNIVIGLRPDIIAVTQGDPQLENKKRQVKMVGGKIIAIPHVNTPSTSEILEIIEKEQ
ncbi:MAG: adenylyltransferase/cytidyltransferase family protein [Patescibacteria group bacterium]|nr:adenylyltransferase/cytidyltransferase family protein [Patescibacteria group bacterium]